MVLKSKMCSGAWCRGFPQTLDVLRGTFHRADRQITFAPLTAAGEAACGRPAERLCGAEERRASSQRAQRASTSDLPHLFERSERSERSELCGRLEDRAPQGSRRLRRPPQSERQPASRTRLCPLGRRLRNQWRIL